MNKSYLAILIVALVILVGVILLTGNEASAPDDINININISSSPVISQEFIDNNNAFPDKTHFVTYTDSGFSPKEITIKKGDIVIFKNNSSGSMWPASAIHPTHENYPGSSIKNCGKIDSVTSQFDSCVGVGRGDSWSFTFNEVGSWGYHDHISAGNTGKIIVK